MKHFINLKEFNTSYLNKIIDMAIMIKNNQDKFSNALKGKKMYMLFQKSSTRTALSFGLGMNELGGIYFIQNWMDSNFTNGKIQDEVRYIARNVDVIMARLKNNEDIDKMAQYSTVPVINGCCNKYHPCQAMADMLTIKEIFGNFNIKLLYIGVKNNVFNSLLASLPKLGGKLYSITPIINQASVDTELINNGTDTGNYCDLDYKTLTQSKLKEIIKDVDIIYTDTWVDMEFFNDRSFESEKNKRIETMIPYQINEELLKGSKAIVMHDMPMHEGYEISREIIEKHKATILHQAENRRHIQKAILLNFLQFKE